MVLHHVSSNNFVIVSVNQTQNMLFIYIWQLLLENMLFQKNCTHRVQWFLIHISMASSLVNNTWLWNYFLVFSCQVFQTVRFKNVQLQQQQKYIYLLMYINLAKRLISMAKSHLLKMMRLKLLVNGLKITETFHQLAGT